MIDVSERQPRSGGSGIGSPAWPGEGRSGGLPDPSRYDLLLAAIPVVLAAAWLLGRATGAPDWATLAAGALVAATMLADGLAVNPPR